MPVATTRPAFRLAPPRLQRAAEGRAPMRIMLYLNTVGSMMGGGAMAMWTLAEALEARGHTVRVAARHSDRWMIRGRQVIRHPEHRDFAWADVVLTAPGPAQSWSPYARRRPSSVVCFVHSAVDQRWKPGRPACELVVWASAALRDAAVRAGYSGTSPDMVQWPVLHPERYRTTPGDAVTLVNLLPEKGAGLFWQMAERMPDVKFLAVHGGWGRDRAVVPRSIPRNVELRGFQSDPREVYRRTRVLLYLRSPDAGPMWLNGVGLTALEAACSGIPTVAYPGPGLVESLGDSAVWVDSFDPAAWEAGVRRCLAEWPERSAAASVVAAGLDPDRQVSEMEAALRSAIVRGGARC